MKEILTGFRKFIMAVGFLLTAVSLLLFGYVPAETWLEHVATVMVAFMATNIGEHIISVGKDWIAERRWSKVAEIASEAKKR